MSHVRIEHWLIVAFSLAGAVHYEWTLHAETTPGFPLDDAWIHLQFARNLARGELFAFNAGDPSAGSTAPLWTMLLAIPSALPLDIISATKCLGLALSTLTALLACALAREVSGLRLAGATAGLAVAVNGRTTWGGMSGMEIPLYTALVAATCWTYVRFRHAGRGAIWGPLAGCAGAARPEIFVLFPVLLGAALIDRRLRFEGRRPLVLASAGFFAVLAAFILVNWLTDGRPLPNTFYAKAGTRGLLNAVLAADWHALAVAATAAPLSALNLAIQWAAGQSLLMVTGAFVGGLVLSGVLGAGRSAGAGAILAFLAIAPLVKGALAPEPPILAHNGRYIVHLLVLYFVVASVGFAWLATQVSRRWIVWTFVGVVLLRLLTTNLREATTYAAQVKAINDMQVRAATWIREYTPAGSVVATNDIGAIGYFSERVVLDTQGLVTPRIIPYRRRGDIVPFLERARPQLVIIFPTWHPEVANRHEMFAEVRRFELRPRTIPLPGPLVVYTTPWTTSSRSHILTANAASRVDLR